ncbi:MAG: PIG-L family deacetylase [Candidatus Liptonbacteria bacterium]|nr:PIG-L family deacetylase [Candidatus Liptonbacteria bacterium]
MGGGSILDATQVNLSSVFFFSYNNIKPLTILGQKILFVTAHPDDESYLAAGTIYKNYQAGGQSFLLCATLGEKGRFHCKENVTESQLKKIRKWELTAAAKFLKISQLTILNLPDCTLSQKLNQKTLLKKILILIKKIKPDLIASFGQDGISGHLDHITTGQVSRSAAKKLKIPFLSFCCPPKLKSAQDQLRLRRKHGRYAPKINYSTFNIKIKVDPKIKLKALKIHRSQLDRGNPFSKLPEGAAEEMLRNEYFSTRFNRT